MLLLLLLLLPSPEFDVFNSDGAEFQRVVRIELDVEDSIFVASNVDQRRP